MKDAAVVLEKGGPSPAREAKRNPGVTMNALVYHALKVVLHSA